METAAMRRSYKLQEFTAHASSVNCLKIGRKSSGVLVTGGDDKKVNIWAIGKPNAILSLTGHQSPVTCVTFDGAEEIVAAGAAGGTVKLWDLEEAKVVHTHPINALEFHPNEFLMATSSMDRTCRFWDLETFEQVDAVGPEALPSKAVLFDESGSHMLSATQDGMRVYAWEPVQMLDFVDVGWSKISDLSLHENKLIGCSFHQTFVGVWVVDLTRVAPFGSAPVDRSSVNSSPQAELVNRLSRPKPTTAEARQQRQTDASSGVSSSSRNSPSEQQQQQQQGAAPSLGPRKPSAGDLSLRAAAVASSSSPSPPQQQQQQQQQNSNHQEDARRPQPYSTNAASTSSRPGSASQQQQQQQQQQQRAPAPQKVSVGTGIGDSLPMSGLDFDKLGVGGGGRRGSASSSSGAAAATSTVVSRQPSGPQPQNLDMEAFLPTEAPASDLLDEAVLEEVMGKHTTMSQILSTRSSNLAVVQRLWAKGDVRGAVAALRRCKDSSVAADVIGAIGHQREAADLEFLQLAGPVLLELLEASHEQWQSVAVEAALAFAKRFGQVIRETLGAAAGGIGTDMAAEARRDKCLASKTALQALVPRLQAVQGSPGDLGRKSRALLEEIQAL